MYQLARILSIVSVLLGIYCMLRLITEVSPYVAVVIGLFVLGYIIRRRKNSLANLGSARWADENDLRNAGMMGGSSGAIIGRLPKHLAGRRVPSVRKLFDKKLSAKEACQAFFRNIHPSCDEFVRLNNVVHTLVCSRTGGGKNVSYVEPLLLTCRDSVVVTDPKAENAKLTAKHRQKKFGQRVVLLDPYKMYTQTPDTFNPLDFIDKDDPRCIDRCYDLATAIVARQAEEREPHFNDSAEIILAAFIATVVQFGDNGSTRSLHTVRDQMTPEKFEATISIMCESECWDGSLRQMGKQLQYYADKERKSVMTTLNRHLRWLDTPVIAASTRTSTFNPAELVTEKVSLYLIQPIEHMRSNPGLMRMWMSSLLRTVQACGTEQQNKVHVIADEFAALKHLPAMDDAIVIGRSSGTRLHLIIQSLAQLKESFPNGQDANAIANCALCTFSVNDLQTAQYISEHAGDSTIIVESGGTSSGSSYQSSQSVQSSTSKSSSYNSNSNWSLQTRRLLKPEEVMRLPERLAITFVPGMPPIATTMVRYYEEKLGRSRWFSRAGAAVATLLMSIVLLGFAAIAANALSSGPEEGQPTYSIPAQTSPY